MDIIIGIILYFIIGFIVDFFSKKRDRYLSSLVDLIVYNQAKGIPVCDACDFFDNVSKINADTLNYAGYWFWRNKKPFSKWSWKIRNAFGFIFWPIDIIMSEIGYKRQLHYLDSKEKLSPEIKRYIKMCIKETMKLQKMIMARMKKGEKT